MKHLKNWILAALLGVNIAGNVSAQTSQQPITVNWGTFNIRYDNPDDQENNWKFRKDRVAKHGYLNMQKLVSVGKTVSKKENMLLSFTVKTVSNYWTVIHSGCLNIRTVWDSSVGTVPVPELLHGQNWKIKVPEKSSWPSILTWTM